MMPGSRLFQRYNISDVFIQSPADGLEHSRTRTQRLTTYVEKHGTGRDDRLIAVENRQADGVVQRYLQLYFPIGRA